MLLLSGKKCDDFVKHFTWLSCKVTHTFRSILVRFNILPFSFGKALVNKFNRKKIIRFYSPNWCKFIGSNSWNECFFLCSLLLLTISKRTNVVFSFVYSSHFWVFEWSTNSYHYIYCPLICFLAFVVGLWRLLIDLKLCAFAQEGLRCTTVFTSSLVAMTRGISGGLARLLLLPPLASPFFVEQKALSCDCWPLLVNM